MKHTGGCLCGAVSYSAGGVLGAILHCHCVNCRKLTGNFIAAARVAVDDLTITDTGGLAWHELGYAKYGFCRTCGSTLFYQASDRPDFMSVTAGTMDDVSDLPLDAVWFADEAQHHNPMPPDAMLHRGNG